MRFLHLLLRSEAVPSTTAGGREPCARARAWGAEWRRESWIPRGEPETPLERLRRAGWATVRVAASVRPAS